MPIGASTWFASYFLSCPIFLSYNRRALSTITITAPLQSQGRDPRLQGVSNGISYNQQESAQAAADDSSASSGRNSEDSIRDSDLETPRDIFAEEEESESTTHNANALTTL
jgi:hypothetical protein